MADSETFELAETDGPSIRPSMPVFDEEPLSGGHQGGQQSEPRTDFKPWTRLAESGPAALQVAVAVLGTMILAWIFADWKTLHIAGWICVLGTALALFLAYPLVVGLERPVRMSPERAVRDYFEALEHHWPLLRRMWIFLAPEGRQSRFFTSQDGFRVYWKRRVKEWQHRGNAWPLTPVAVAVGHVEQKPDAESPNIRHLHFIVQISLRGKRHAGPVATYELDWSAVRGPDKQWYLMNGDLPE